MMSRSRFDKVQGFCFNMLRRAEESEELYAATINKFIEDEEKDVRGCYEDITQRGYKEDMKDLKDMILFSLMFNQAQVGVHKRSIMALHRHHPKVDFGRIIDCDWKGFDNSGLMWALANALNDDAAWILDFVKENNAVFTVDGIDTFQERMYGKSDKLSAGNTSLHIVVAKGYTDRDFSKKPLKISNFALAEKLIVDHNANPNIRNKAGYTALDLAVLRRDGATVELILTSPLMTSDTIELALSRLGKSFEECQHIVQGTVDKKCKSLESKDFTVENNRLLTEILIAARKRLKDRITTLEPCIIGCDDGTAIAISEKGRIALSHERGGCIFQAEDSAAAAAAVGDHRGVRIFKEYAPASSDVCVEVKDDRGRSVVFTEAQLIYHLNRLIDGKTIYRKDSALSTGGVARASAVGLDMSAVAAIGK